MDPNQIPQGMSQGMPPGMSPGVPPELQAGGQPQGVPGDDQPITPEQKQALVDMISKIKEQLGSVDALKMASKNKLDVIRQELLQQVFQELQRAGVDLSSKESVSAFILNLQQRNPQLAAMFEKSMDILLGVGPGEAFGAPQGQGMPPGIPGMPTETPEAPGGASVPPQNMNNPNPNETIPQNVPGYNTQA